jgi:hypothetical protein
MFPNFADLQFWVYLNFSTEYLIKISKKEMFDRRKSVAPFSFFCQKDSIYRTPEICLEMKLSENSEI